MKTENILIFLFFAFQYVSSDNTIYDNESIQQWVERDPYLESYLREALENFRLQMKDGIDEMRIPALDPFELRHLDTSLNEKLNTMYLKLKMIRLQGLSSFVCHDLYPDLENYFLKINLTIPSVEFSSKYDLNGKMLKIFPLRGYGNMEINISNVEISGVGQLEPVNKTLVTTTMDLDLKWNSMNIFLENFLGGGKFSEIIQKMISKVGPGIFDNLKPKILRHMNKSLRNAINKQLKKPNVKEIIEKIMESTYEM